MSNKVSISINGVYASFAMFVVVLALSAAVVGENANRVDTGSKQSQVTLGCSGTVLALGAVGTIVMMALMIVYHVNGGEFSGIKVSPGGRLLYR